ncbi:Fatty acyl-CoA reductase 3 [Sesamum angolense]|uniref:Fatty acyl-CoA reductase n=1 Tax=Sesamum angolense TaxID=2727404 RepID=A0AAE1XC37_9LAMI|nr:Fatty acyl-CoA reductase 3 [Sesamum angolense]
MLLHVSTAYVHGMRIGLIPEVPFHMGQTLPGAQIPCLDINTEKKIVEERLRQLHTLNSTPKQITSALKELGMESGFCLQVLSLELFRVVKEEFDSNGIGRLLEKLVPISGDVSLENLGIIEWRVREEIWREVNIIVNSAGTTKFNERYDDVPLGINAMGSMHVQHFARKCSKLEMLLHVSTAYVHGMRAEVIPEVPFHMGQTLPGAQIPCLDIHKEKKIVEERLRQLHTLNSTPKQITSALKELGMERTVDAIFASYGKGKLTFFLADPQSIVDMIPGDMVVNAMVAAIARHSNDQPSPNYFVIYHVGSSKRNPIYLQDVASLTYQYFREKPVLDNRGNPFKMGGELKLLSSITSFRRHVKIRSLPFVKILKLLNMIFCHKFERSYTNSSRALYYSLRLAEFYKPYSLFQGTYTLDYSDTNSNFYSFDDANTESLRMTTRKYNSNIDMFGFDPKCIQWEEYLMNAHFPGVFMYLRE